MQKKIPLRKCMVCGEMKEKKELVRVVKNKESQIFIDETGKANGRGAYICKSKGCLEKAKKKNVFNRAFKVNVSDELYKELEEKFND